LRQYRFGKDKPLIGNVLFQKCEAASGCQNIIDLCPLSTTEARELLNAFYSVCHRVPIYFLWRPNLKDEGDNFLIALAVVENSNLIITNNIKGLREAELTFENLKIQTPETFLRGE